jgi:hypothetical protein
MNRVKEIDVWVRMDDPETPTHISSWSRSSPDDVGRGWVIAKLIVPLSERKVEITESQLRDCFDTFRTLGNDHDRRLVYSFYEFTKERLFEQTHNGRG